MNAFLGSIKIYSMTTFTNIEHIISPAIIREYDIRGIVGQNLTADDAFILGLKIVQYLENIGVSSGSICIGYDGRVSSPLLYKALCAGLSYNAQYSIVAIGLVATPTLYLAYHVLDKIRAAVMITGSHNTREYNGFKIVINNVAICGDDLKNLVATNHLQLLQSDIPQSIQYCDMTKYHVMKLQQILSSDIPLKVVWDPGNGAACGLVNALTQTIAGTHHVINGVVDGFFPAHDPDPSEEKNLSQLIDTVKKLQYDFGVAFDGDGDRLVVVDAKGRMFSGAHLLYIFGCDLVSRYTRPVIITDCKMSRVVINALEKQGATVNLFRTGHAFIKNKMLHDQVMLAVEMSGHIFMAEDYYCFDDAIFSACRFISIASSNPVLVEQSFDIMADSFQAARYKLPCITAYDAFIIEVTQYLQFLQYSLSNDDGIRAENEDGWILLRRSNTEECFYVIGEAYSQRALLQINNVIQKCCDMYSKYYEPALQ